MQGLGLSRCLELEEETLSGLTQTGERGSSNSFYALYPHISHCWPSLRPLSDPMFGGRGPCSPQGLPARFRPLCGNFVPPDPSKNASIHGQSSVNLLSIQRQSAPTFCQSARIPSKINHNSVEILTWRCPRVCLV